MGADLKVKKWEPVTRWQRANPRGVFYTLDIVEGRNEHFLLTYGERLPEFQVLDLDKKRRHLLLLVRDANTSTSKEKFLCGHDERHWFAAAVANAGVVNVSTAMQSLKPTEVQAMERRTKVKRKNRNKRKNAAFLRQGEWFFLPRPNFEPVLPHLLHYKEPISRGGGGKPHIVEWLYRTRGETVYVNRRFPNGLTADQIRDRMLRDSSIRMRDFVMRQRGMRVFAKGRISHPDHYTLTLPGWHEVVMNREARTANLAFLD